MTKWMRRSESRYLDNLARKARRRGDALEAARWYKAAAARDANIARWQTLNQRETGFEQQQAEREYAMLRAEEEDARRNSPGAPEYAQQRAREFLRRYEASLQRDVRSEQDQEERRRARRASSP